MKILKLVSVLIVVFSMAILLESCKKDPCESLVCLNDGVCIDGACECSDGFTGTDCEDFDASAVQELLDMGYTPMALINGNVPLDSLYGNMYEGGLIFYYDPINNTGMVAALDDLPDGYDWGCFAFDASVPDVTTCPEDCFLPEPEDNIVGARIGDGLSNTIAIVNDNCNNMKVSAAEACYLHSEGGYDDWFLPSRGELNEIYHNLRLTGHDEFQTFGYWSSTEHSNVNSDGKAWLQNFLDGSLRGSYSKSSNIYVRPVRTF